MLYVFMDRRLGTKYHDTYSILSHPFFNDFNITSLSEKNYVPKVPYVPSVSSNSNIFKRHAPQKLVGLPKLEQNFGGNDQLFENF